MIDKVFIVLSAVLSVLVFLWSFFLKMRHLFLTFFRGLISQFDAITTLFVVLVISKIYDIRSYEIKIKYSEHVLQALETCARR